MTAEEWNTRWPITPAQVRCARAMLRWTLKEMTQRAGVSGNTVARYEAGVEPYPSQKTLETLRQAFEYVGFSFYENDGVKAPQ